MSARNTHRERAEARYVIGQVWKNFGNRAFRVDPGGKHIEPLRAAERRGWCWFPGKDRCALTDAGVLEAMTDAGVN